MASGFWKFGGFKLLDPAEILDAARRNGTTTEFWGRVNSFRCPRGREPGVGYLLMRGKDLSRTVTNTNEGTKTINGQLNTNVSQKLEYFENGSSTAKLTIPRLYVTRALRMTRRSREDDEDGAYLVEVMDIRRLLQMSAHASGTLFLSNFNTWNNYTNSYTPELSWQQLIDILWSELRAPSPLNSAPSLPYTPAGAPQETIIYGGTIWDNIFRVLDMLACTLVYNPISDAFSIVEIGASQPGLTSTMEDLKDKLVFDYDPICPVGSNVPGGVTIYNPHRYKNNSQSFSRSLTGAWVSTPVVTPPSGANFNRRIPFYDTSRATLSETLLIENSTELSDRHSEIAPRILSAAESVNQRIRKHYGGIVTDILPGSEITEVAWRDYGDGSGPQTEIVQGPRTETKPAVYEVASCFGPPDNSPHLNHLDTPLVEQVIVDFTDDPLQLYIEPTVKGSGSAGFQATKFYIAPGRLVTVNMAALNSPGGSFIRNTNTQVWIMCDQHTFLFLRANEPSLLSTDNMESRLFNAVRLGLYDPDPGGEDSDQRPLYAIGDFPKAIPGVYNSGSVEAYYLKLSSPTQTATGITLPRLFVWDPNMQDGTKVLCHWLDSGVWLPVPVVTPVDRVIAILPNDATPGTGTMTIDGLTVSRSLITETIPAGTRVLIERVGTAWFLTAPTNGPFPS